MGALLRFYPGEEIYYDAGQIRGLLPFYTSYVESMPGLSLHGQHFPPGHATWMYGLRLLAGDSVLAVGIAVGAFFFIFGLLVMDRELTSAWVGSAGDVDVFLSGSACTSQIPNCTNDADFLCPQASCRATRPLFRYPLFRSAVTKATIMATARIRRYLLNRSGSWM